MQCVIMNLSTRYLLDSQFLLKMNYCFDLWNFDAEESPFKIQDSQFESQCFPDLQISDPVGQYHHDNSICPSSTEEKIGLLLKPNFCLQSNNSLFLENGQKNPQIPQTHQTKRVSKNRKKRIIKPSPYHNYQKHLNSTLKQLIILPQLQLSSPIYHCLAHDLWGVFKESTLSTKKILHFIFNQFNEYQITKSELRELGFVDIYEKSTRSELGQAKDYLTQLTLSQLSQQNLGVYLSHRRIKNQIKFKKYLMLFRQELQDGFIKKRFTNRSRKEQIKKKRFRQCCK